VELNSSMRRTSAEAGDGVADFETAWAAITEAPSGELEEAADNRNLCATQDEDDDAAREGGQARPNSRPPSPLTSMPRRRYGWQLAPAIMPIVRSAPARLWREQQHQEAISSMIRLRTVPWFERRNLNELPNGAENIDRFFRPRELEEQRLQQDAGHRELQQQLKRLDPRQLDHAGLDDPARGTVTIQS
jgi:hypothetical protein